jgi:hypothetical protein
VEISSQVYGEESEVGLLQGCHYYVLVWMRYREILPHLRAVEWLPLPDRLKKTDLRRRRIGSRGIYLVDEWDPFQSSQPILRRIEG